MRPASAGLTGLGGWEKMDGNVKWRTGGRSGERESLDRRRYAAVAGVLCAGASLCTLASSILLESTAALTAIALAAFGLLLAFACFVIPWERVGTYLVRL